MLLNEKCRFSKSRFIFLAHRFVPKEFFTHVRLEPDNDKALLKLLKPPSIVYIKRKMEKAQGYCIFNNLLDNWWNRPLKNLLVTQNLLVTSLVLKGNSTVLNKNQSNNVWRHQNVFIYICLTELESNCKGATKHHWATHNCMLLEYRGRGYLDFYIRLTYVSGKENIIPARYSTVICKWYYWKDETFRNSSNKSQSNVTKCWDAWCVKVANILLIP